MFSRSNFLRAGLVALGMVAAAFVFVIWSWFYTTSRLNSARMIGVFPSPAEGMLSLVQSDYIGIQEARITGVYPETSPLGGGPHVWFVTVCVWADSREDGSPVGSSTHDFDFGGSYFVDTHEGWVLMRESSLPLFVGFWMPVFDLAGDGDDSTQPYHDPSTQPRRPCVRQDG